MPVQVIGGENSAVPGVYNSGGDGGPSYQGLGNLQLHGKLRMTRVERDGIGLAALLRVELPTGTSEKFAGEPGLALWPELVAEYRPIPQIRFGLNAGYRFNSGKGVQNFPVDGRVFPSGANATAPMLDPRIPAPSLTTTTSSPSAWPQASASLPPGTSFSKVTEPSSRRPLTRRA